MVTKVDAFWSVLITADLCTTSGFTLIRCSAAFRSSHYTPNWPVVLFLLLLHPPGTICWYSTVQKHCHFQTPLENPSVQTHLVLLCCEAPLYFRTWRRCTNRYYYLVLYYSYYYYTVHCEVLLFLIMYVGVGVCIRSSSWMDWSHLWLQAARPSSCWSSQCLLLLHIWRF